MDDRQLERLLMALDVAAERLPSAATASLHGDVEHAALRLEALRATLGTRVSASPYLAFIRRMMAEQAPQVPLAASA